MERSGLVQQGYRFELDPTSGQAELLGSFAGASRFWFNQGLRLVKERLDRRAAGDNVRVPWSYTALCSEFKGARTRLSEWTSA